MSEPDMALAVLGFTKVESQIYYELLKSSPATGYRLAQQLGKAPNNVYQPLKALVQKGAVFVNEASDETPTYIPVPPRQLLGNLEQDFAKHKNNALASLEKVMEPKNDVVVTQLRTAAQVFGTARSMLAAASEVVLFDCMPEIYDLLADDIARAKSRGVTIAGLAYRDGDAAATIPRAADTESDIGSRWPGHGLILVIDGCEQLIALLSKDHASVYSAVYSDSVFLSCIFHNTLAADIRLAALIQDNPNLRTASVLLDGAPPGQRHMIRLAQTS